MTQKITHVCQGTCSRQIDVELENGVVRSVSFTGGCHGNQQGIAALVRGMTAAEAVARLEGIDCRGRGTSCPDQLAKALKKALENAPARPGTDFALRKAFQNARLCIFYGIC